MCLTLINMVINSHYQLGGLLEETPRKHISVCVFVKEFPERREGLHWAGVPDQT